MKTLAWAIVLAAALIADAMQMKMAKGNHHYIGYEIINFVMVISFLGLIITALVSQ
jgi:hypothetical protein